MTRTVFQLSKTQSSAISFGDVLRYVVLLALGTIHSLVVEGGTSKLFTLMPVPLEPEYTKILSILMYILLTNTFVFFYPRLTFYNSVIRRILAGLCLVTVLNIAITLAILFIPTFIPSVALTQLFFLGLGVVFIALNLFYVYRYFTQSYRWT